MFKIKFVVNIHYFFEIKNIENIIKDLIINKK